MVKNFENNFDARVNVVHDNPYVDLIFDIVGPEMGSAMGHSDAPTGVEEEAINDATQYIL